MDQSVSRRSVSGSEAHRQGPQAAFGGSLESFAVVKEIPVEVKADVCLQALRKTLQHLRCMKKESLRGMCTVEARTYMRGIFLINYVINNKCQ